MLITENAVVVVVGGLSLTCTLSSSGLHKKIYQMFSV